MAKYVYERWDYFYEVKPGHSTTSLTNDRFRRISKNGEIEETILRPPLPTSALYVGQGYTTYYNSGSTVSIYTGEQGADGRFSYFPGTKNDIISSLHATVLIEELIAEEGTYPDNGIQGDYWYIKTRKVFPDLHVKVNGELRKVQSAWVKVGGHTTPELPEGHREYIAYANSPDGSVDFVSMGWGENLLLNSGVSVTNSGHRTQTYSMSQRMMAGQTYTIQIWGQLGEGKERFQPYLNVGIGPNLLVLMEKVSDGYYVGTFQGKEGVDYTEDKLLVYAQPSTVVVDSTIDKIKLELGSEPTPWQPHSSEVQDRHYVGLYQGLDPDDYRGEGENLIKNSIFPVKNHGSQSWESVLVDTPFGEHTIGKYTVTKEPVTSSLIRIQNAIPDVGEYTLSFWARTANQGEKANIAADIADLPPWTTTEITSEWKQYSVTSNVTSNVIYRHADIGIRSLNVPIYIAFWKLEKGSTATPWTPAPADIIADINNPNSYTWMSKSMYMGVLKEVKDIYVKKDGHLKKGI